MIVDCVGSRDRRAVSDEPGKWIIVKSLKRLARALACR